MKKLWKHSPVDSCSLSVSRSFRISHLFKLDYEPEISIREIESE